MGQYELRKLVAKNIRRIRRAKDFSQDYVGFEAKSDRVHISNIERGKVNVSIDMLERIIKALEVEPEELFK